MSLTNTERVILWGQKENPEKYREYQLKEKKRYQRKKKYDVHGGKHCA